MDDVAVIDRQTLNVIVYDAWITLNIHHTRHLDPWIREIYAEAL